MPDSLRGASILAGFGLTGVGFVCSQFGWWEPGHLFAYICGVLTGLGLFYNQKQKQ